MTDAEGILTCWRSKENGPWHQITVGVHSLVGHRLLQLGGTEIYDDNYGNRYRMASPELMGEEPEVRS